MSLIAIPFMGLFVSLVSVFIGLGGGILLVPLLPEVFNLSVHEAVATSLATITMVVAENTLKFSRAKLVAWPVVLTMGPLSAVTAIIAAQITQRVDPKYVLYLLVILLVAIAIRTLFISVLKRPYEVKNELSRKDKALAMSGGAMAGLTSGFAGVGSGIILSPVMIFLRLVKPEQLAPSANANMLFTTSAATLSFLFSGSFVAWNQWGLIRWDLALGLFLSASFFSHFLRPHQNKLPFKIKSLLLAVLLIFLTVKIVTKLSS